MREDRPTFLPGSVRWLEGPASQRFSPFDFLFVTEALNRSPATCSKRFALDLSGLKRLFNSPRLHRLATSARNPGGHLLQLHHRHTFAGNGRRARICRRCSFAANILATSGLTPSNVSISPQADAASTRQQGSSDRALPVRAKFGRARGPWCVPFAARWRLSVRLAGRELAHLHT